ncbi:MAG: hypothetical protein A2063_02725 [Gallionellales bacterium GWA2_60_142]|nr:MAG: hypothetical protein A2063_02725 [Gallionellales bacterium GWA2_60_142]
MGVDFIRMQRFYPLPSPPPARGRESFSRLLDALERRAQLRITRLFFSYAHALVVTQQMRRGIAADLVPGGMQDGLQHRAHRALAVGAADDDDRKFGLESQPLLDLSDAIQAKLYGLGVQGF